MTISSGGARRWPAPVSVIILRLAESLPATASHAPPVPHRIAAVVLAAGGSSRLGAPKQLVVHGGEPLVRRAARAALDAGASPVVIVLGAHADAVAPTLADLAVTVVANAAWATGLASSLRVGVGAALDSGADAVLVTLADQPLVDGAALRRLLDAYPGAHGVVAAAYGDVIGVPAVFARAHAESLLALDGDAGAGRWLRRRGDALTAVPLPEAATDVDTPDDVRRLGASPTLDR